MISLIGSQLDEKNIGLVKLLYGLRQELDVLCLIGINADELNQGSGKSFFGYLQQMTTGMITLSICNIYEKEDKKYQLNSIDGVFSKLSAEYSAMLDDSKFGNFINTYNGPSDRSDKIGTIGLTIKGFRIKYEKELEEFKTARDKIYAHSEYGIDIDALPSYNVLEDLFFFGADFYDLVSSAIGTSPILIKDDRPVKISFKNMLQQLGLREVNEDMD